MKKNYGFALLSVTLTWVSLCATGDSAQATFAGAGRVPARQVRTSCSMYNFDEKFSCANPEPVYGCDAGYSYGYDRFCYPNSNSKQPERVAGTPTTHCNVVNMDATHSCADEQVAYKCTNPNYQVSGLDGFCYNPNVAANRVPAHQTGTHCFVTNMDAEHSCADSQAIMGCDQGMNYGFDGFCYRGNSVSVIVGANELAGSAKQFGSAPDKRVGEQMMSSLDSKSYLLPPADPTTGKDSIGGSANGLSTY